jgi:CDP-diacylglycerol--serine O-phosphatidyltransferase
VTPPAPRRNLRRAIVVVPSAFTLGNLFLGIWAIVTASRGDYNFAAWLIVMAAVMDMLDGRIARYTSTGSEFGEQLDSLVDIVSFGVAPAIIFFFTFLSDGGTWAWTLSFIYVASVAVRLARFNVEQAGSAKSNFHGLPSPTAGMTVATFYPFSQTEFFQRTLTHLPWHALVVGMVLALSALMMSHVLYPVVPRFDLRTRRGQFAMLLAIGSIIAAFTVPALFFFPAAVIYISLGLLRAVVQGFDTQLPTHDPLIDVDETEDGARELEYDQIEPRRPVRGRFRNFTRRKP